MFKHQLVPRVEISDTTTEAGRVYHTPDGDFRSVTTRIGDAADKGWLDEWKKRVGEEEARGISIQASRRGTAVHAIAEKYMLNDPDWKKGAMPVNLVTFLKFKRILDESIDLVYGIEYPLWSKELQTAGKSDLPCVFRGKNAIVDFKTSKREKKVEDIEGYFIQSACYAMMFRLRTGIRVDHMAVLIACDDGDCQVFEADVRPWIPAVQRVFL